MPSTDIDGSVIVILSRDEAERVYALLQAVAHDVGLNPVERKIAGKIARDLELSPISE